MLLLMKEAKEYRDSNGIGINRGEDLRFLFISFIKRKVFDMILILLVSRVDNGVLLEVIG